MSVPMATLGFVPMKRTSSGVMSGPPPMPVMPIRMPTPRPKTMTSGSMGSSGRGGGEVCGDRRHDGEACRLHIGNRDDTLDAPCSAPDAPMAHLNHLGGVNGRSPGGG